MDHLGILKCLHTFCYIHKYTTGLEGYSCNFPGFYHSLLGWVIYCPPHWFWYMFLPPHWSLLHSSLLIRRDMYQNLLVGQYITPPSLLFIQEFLPLGNSYNGIVAAPGIPPHQAMPSLLDMPDAVTILLQEIPPRRNSCM